MVISAAAVLAWLGMAKSPPLPAQTAAKFPCMSGRPTNVRQLLRVTRSVELSQAASHPIVELTSVALGRHGATVVADAGDYNLKLFDQHGRFLRALGRRGDGPGEFRSPAAVAFVGDTAVVAVDRYHARLTMFRLTGELLGTALLPAIRSVGGILYRDGDLYVAGLGPWTRSARDSLWALHLSDLSGSTAGHFGLIPNSYLAHPALTSGPVYLAMASQSDSVMFVTWRFSAELWKLDLQGQVRQTQAVPSTRFFVDPRLALRRRGNPPASELVAQTSPIMGLAASQRYIVLGFFSPVSNDKTLRWDVFGRDLGVIATDLPGPLFVVGIADTLVAVEGGRSRDFEVRYRLVWYVPC